MHFIYKLQQFIKWTTFKRHPEQFTKKHRVHPYKVYFSMRFLKLGFFHQTTPPGPMRGSQEPFLILATFHGVIQVLKRLPGIRDNGESQTPGVPDAE